MVIDALGTGWWEGLGEQWAELRRVVGFWQPMTALPAWSAPALAVASLLALVIASGVALLALGVLLIASLFVHLLLDRVFGVSLMLAPPR